uniref:Protein kinase domain-containing protein n=1 Tax=Meloidogyne javanica TaxID=6303 RepID=A0A915N0R0_MELJA
MSIPKPDLIGGEEYIYESLLGNGSFGKVYKCKNKKGQLLAIKRIKDQQATWEAKIMSSLSGPEYNEYFAQFYKLFKSYDGSTCIVMEYCELGSLEDVDLR